MNKPGNRQISYSHTRAWEVQWVEVPAVLYGFVGLHILTVFKPIYKVTETDRLKDRWTRIQKHICTIWWLDLRKSY